MAVTQVTYALRYQRHPDGRPVTFHATLPLEDDEATAEAEAAALAQLRLVAEEYHWDNVTWSVVRITTTEEEVPGA